MDVLRVPFRTSSAGLVRRRLVGDLTARGVPADLLDDAALVVSELVGNALRHGAPLPGGGLDAAWEMAPDSVHVEVTDGGEGHDDERSWTRAGSADDESGRGLAIIGMLSRRWGAGRTSVGRCVWVDLPLPTVPALYAGAWQLPA